MQASEEHKAEPMRNPDGSVMLDDNAEVVYRSQFLDTHPLKRDCKERVATPGGRRLTYVTGDGVIRTMNAAFGHTGWSTEITREKMVHCQQEQGKWAVGYMATVRVTLQQTKVSHEDVGFGEGLHESKLKALDNALKSAITDAMKRAARHFGERLGNALYMSGSGFHVAPKDNKTALKNLERKQALDWFGDQKQKHQSSSPNKASPSKDESSAQESQRLTIADGAQESHRLTIHNMEAGARVSLPLETTRQTPQQQAGFPQGFTRACDLAGVMVTPAHQSNAMNTTASRTVPSPTISPPSPQQANDATWNQQPRYSPNQRMPAPQVQHPQDATFPPTKRQRLAHNPYQR